MQTAIPCCLDFAEMGLDRFPRSPPGEQVLYLGVRFCEVLQLFSRCPDEKALSSVSVVVAARDRAHAPVVEERCSPLRLPWFVWYLAMSDVDGRGVVSMCLTRSRRLRRCCLSGRLREAGNRALQRCVTPNALLPQHFIRQGSGERDRDRAEWRSLGGARDCLPHRSGCSHVR
ncbi:hypothetical protein BDY21DRAFT_46438 [Lineolata rhizophorae]|uniref:Uncharacterized protein n=1 Tax=Lineolata rhizophorae TaxID=578093 RepID=A0A6A6NYV6_9PEZI|nr:hypothetical protein BDY21DRAFT_46438 [Lineolata rhizophorae]